MTQHFYVKADWDADASVWVSESNIPGLVIEAETLDEFRQLVGDLAPEMLADNLGIHNESVPVDFQVWERRELAVA